jgi:hypothetical protein
MDRKKISILTFALIVLFGGIFFIASSINKESATTGQAPIKKEENANLFGQSAEESKISGADITGSVEIIAEKTLTVKNSQELVVVNINGSTPVMLIVGNASPVVGQMADLKKGDLVKVTYDKVNKNTMLISVSR